MRVILRMQQGRTLACLQTLWALYCAHRSALYIVLFSSGQALEILLRIYVLAESKHYQRRLS